MNAIIIPMTTADKAVEAVKNIDFAAVADKALDMTKQFVEAATPVAKKAYEVGLMTLQIDAAQSIIFGFSWLILFIFLLYKLPSWYEKANKDEWMSFAPGMSVVLGTIFAGISLIIWTCELLSVWTWVKLFKPELWLVHQAIEKLVK